MFAKNKNPESVLLAMSNYHNIIEAGNDNQEYNKCILSAEYWTTKIRQYDPIYRQELFMTSIENNYDHYIITLLNDDNVDPAANDNYAIRYACKNNMLNVVSLLLASEKIDPSVSHNYCIRVAVVNNNTDMVRLLLSYDSVDPSRAYSVEEIEEMSKECDPAEIEEFKTLYSLDLILVAAIDHCNTEMVDIMLVNGKVDPSISNNIAVTEAVTNNNISMVETLMRDDRVDTTIDEDHLLRYAVDHLGDDMVKQLLKHPKANPNTHQGYILLKCVLDRKISTLSLIADDPRVNLTIDSQNAFTSACAAGNVDAVMLMLPHVDPSAYSCNAIKVAQYGNHKDIVDILMRDGRSRF